MPPHLLLHHCTPSNSPARPLKLALRRLIIRRYINHSCAPNLVQHLVRAGSLIPRVALFAIRDIAQGDELTMYYGDIPASHGDLAQCHPTIQDSLDDGSASAGRTHCICGEDVCTGYLPFDDS